MLVSNTCRDCPKLEVVRRLTDEDGWETTELFSDALDGLLEEHFKDSNITLIFAQANRIRECSTCQKVFRLVLKMPPFWWSHWCKRANGYFGCENTTDEQGDFNGHIKQTFPKPVEKENDYLWYKLNAFTRWIPSTRQSIVVVFDPRPKVKERVLNSLLESSDVSDSSEPYWIHSLFTQEIVRLQDKAVWGIRNLVRQTEVERTTSNAPNPNYLRLHDIARHAIHVSETLELAVRTVESIMEQHDNLTISTINVEGSNIKQRKILSRMKFYHHMVRSLQSRSKSNKERLLNEIQLAFNTVAQYDSRISVDIGQAAQKDSSAMKTIAFLTMTFFPATFISAIFSTSFFNFNPDTDEWSISSMFWVYWAVTIPITSITAGLWLFWYKVFPPRRIGEELQPRGVDLAKKGIKVLLTELGIRDEDWDVMGKV